MKASGSNTILDGLKNNIVVVIFALLCTITIYYSNQPLPFIIREIVTRLGRNTVLVLSLILPVLCGLGLNFSIVVGAMAGEIGLICITHWQIDGILGIAVAALIGTAAGILFGILTGNIFNKTKGQEMITGMILGYFSLGAWDFMFIFLVGSLIPMKNPEMVLDTGVGLRNTINFRPATQQAIDKFMQVPMVTFLRYAFVVFLAAFVLYVIYKSVREKQPLRRVLGETAKAAVGLVILGILALLTIVNEQFRNLFFITNVPVLTGILIALVCLLSIFIMRTKLGQDIRTVGQNMNVAVSAGINVNKVRTISVIFSIVIAAWGQIIFLQNLGNINTYASHEQVGIFAVASLLVGGASISRATIPQVFIGVVLFHTLYFTSPLAGKTLLNDPMYGEYFRLFVSNGVIAVSLALYTWRRLAAKKRAMELE